ncbi:MAG: AbrB/MazE/SpoVT family DNA-binding domain-containing protein [Chloroflexi bacterium]|nr:MAG: AbrB/MazE/SpoVT family DNA-binding domain-containing protein [Chloroflexota bacterium]
MNSVTIQMRQKGIITLPVELRRQYQFNEGDVFTLIDLGNGTLVLKPATSKVAKYGDEVGRIMAGEDVNLEEMLQLLNEERQEYYKDHYVNP